MSTFEGDDSSVPWINIYTPKEQKAIDIGLAITSGLSILGTLVMIFLIFVKMNRYRKEKQLDEVPVAKSTASTFGSSAVRPNESGSVPLRSRDGSSLTKQRKTAKKIWILAFYGELLVLNLAIADLGSSLVYIGVLLYKYTTKQCYSAALQFSATVFEPASILWVSCISTTLPILLAKSRNFLTEKQVATTLTIQIILFSLISWIIPILFATWRYFKKQYNGSFEETIWCLSKNTIDDLYLFYLPVLVAFFYNIIMLTVIYVVNKRKKLGLKNFNLMWWALVFFAVWTVPGVNVLYPLLKDKQTQPFLLQLIASLSLPLQGFLNSIIWTTALYSQAEKQKVVKDEEVFLLGKQVLTRAYVNLFGNNLEWFIEEK